MITKNVGTADKAARWVVGLGLAFGTYKASGVVAILLGLAAAGAIVTALLGWCGLYTLLGINTVGVGVGSCILTKY
ncbi:MAG: DUF2892 domain-containing protein [Elusimicrobia bacterium]|nr:DUF2892 domain-containing protein [Elusimicrobiota bacterium]